MFGKALFEGFDMAYHSGAYDIGEFGMKCYAMWKLLPDCLNHEQPFFTLCYVDEPLPWGEKQNRALLESAFSFYREKNNSHQLVYDVYYVYYLQQLCFTYFAYEKLHYSITNTILGNCSLPFIQ